MALRKRERQQQLEAFAAFQRGSPMTVGKAQAIRQGILPKQRDDAGGGTQPLRAVIPKIDSPMKRRWTKDGATKRAVYNNRRRTKRDRGKHLSRVRSELAERSFAQV